jgi:queuine tRNA-ribosyltransferase
MGPLDPACSCPACTSYSRAYLHHVVKAGEIIASMLLTWHNLTFFQDLMRALREAIAGKRAAAFAKAFLTEYRPAVDTDAQG